MWPRVKDRLVCNTSLLSHLEQRLLRYIILGRVFLRNGTNLLITIEVLGCLVLLDDCRWVDLRVLGLLLEEEAFGEVLLLTLESSEILN